MARFGALFLASAMGPVHHAARCMMARQIDVGLVELTRDSLMGSVERGAATVAATIGVPVNEVKRILPLDALEAEMQRIEESQWHAQRQWRAHTGQAGGLLGGIADLTEDGHPPNASLCLARLAEKMKLDKELSAPLRSLGREVERWVVLVERCAAVLDHESGFSAKYRRRRIGRFLALATTALATVLAMMLSYRWWAARQRIAFAIGSPSPCDAEALDERDLGRASSEQRAALDRRRQACVDLREAEKKRALAERAAADRASEQQRKSEQHALMCEDLGRHVEAGALTAQDERLAGARAPLLRRVAAGTIAGADIAGVESLPCDGTPGGKLVTRAFARAIVSGAAGWVLAHRPSKRAVAILSEHRADIGDEQWAHFGGHVEEIARRAVISGEDEALDHARSLCEAKKAIGFAHKQQCEAASRPPTR